MLIVLVAFGLKSAYRILLKPLEQNLFNRKHSSKKYFPPIKLNQSLSVGTKFQPPSINYPYLAIHEY